MSLKYIKERKFIKEYLKTISVIEKLFLGKEYEFLGEVIENIKKTLDEKFREDFKKEFHFDIGEVDTSGFGYTIEERIKTYVEFLKYR